MWRHVTILVLVTLLLNSEALWGVEPVPGNDEQQAALKLIREVFEADYAKARTSAQKVALSKKLFQAASTIQGDPASRYMLLRTSRDIAAKEGDVRAAFDAIGQLVDKLQASPAAKSLAEEALGMAKGHLELLRELVAANVK